MTAQRSALPLAILSWCPVSDKEWFVYVVECSDGSLYTGVTTDVSRRVHEHNHTSKAAKYTRARRPVTLRYWIDFATRSTACKAEAAFKKLTRPQKNVVISERLLGLLR